MIEKDLIPPRTLQGFRGQTGVGPDRGQTGTFHFALQSSKCPALRRHARTPPCLILGKFSVDTWRLKEPAPDFGRLVDRDW